MKLKAILLVALAVGLLAAVSSPQERGKQNSRAAAKTTPTPSPTPRPTVETVPSKRNERPGNIVPSATPLIKEQASGPVYTYVFTRPGFTFSRIVVEHDRAGRGKISFQKSSFDEAIEDPIHLSAVTMNNLNDALDGLNFLDSTEDYQYPRDYSHMGIVEFTLKDGARTRTARYNWTDNKYARALMDEYRRISNEYTWRFEIDLARQNQPLLTPSIMESIDSYVTRKEISDPDHLVPFLTELSNDERLPLIARNRTARVIKMIEKAKR